jgi:uncharacterized RDD family membrane protein YckC
MAYEGTATSGAQTTSVDTTDVVGRRIGALIIDSLLLVPVFILIGVATGGGKSGDGGASVHLGGGGFLLFIALTLLYFTVCEGTTGQTLGKRLLGIRVVSEDGSRPSWGAAVLRNVLRIVDSLPFLYIIGLICVLATGERRQRVGDMAAHTRVVRA